MGADLDHPLIDLNCRHRRVCGEQMAGQRALAGPKLDNAETIVIAGSERAQRVVQPLDDPACDRRVGEEVLAEALLGLGPVAVPARRRSDAVQAGRPRQWQLGRRQERDGRQPAPHARGLRSSVRPRREGGNSRGNAPGEYLRNLPRYFSYFRGWIARAPARPALGSVLSKPRAVAGRRRACSRARPEPRPPGVSQ